MSTRRTFLKEAAGATALVGERVWLASLAGALLGRHAAALQQPKSMVTEEQALAFVDRADFSKLPGYRSGLSHLGSSAFEPAANKNQGVVTASAIHSFVKGVTNDRRNALVDSSLFAQLVANKTVPDQADISGWYGAYLNALTSVGWVLQSKSFATYDFKTGDVDVHEAILAIASGLLGGAASTGLALIKSTLDAMKKLEDNSPWITLFRRESQHDRSARFQVSLVNQDAGSDFLVSLMAFALESTQTLNQVLFFRTRSTNATLRYCSGDVTINDRVLKAVGPKIVDKIADFYRGYVQEIDLGVVQS